MSKIKIIPIIDIKKGLVVYRDNVNMVQQKNSWITFTDPTDPLEVVKTYKRIGFTEIYVADLEGILYSKPDYDTLDKLSFVAGIRVMADIGTWSVDDIFKLPRIKPVFATESFSSLNLVEIHTDLIVRIGIKEDKFLSAMDIPLTEFISLIKDNQKMNEVALIDLSRAIEVSRGPNLEMCQYIRNELADKTIIYGGGIRGLEDIHSLSDIGIQKVIVGSAIHSPAIFKAIEAGLVDI